MTSTRGFWPMRDLPTMGWLVAAVAVSLVHPFVPAPRWLMIHLLVLGAAGHAVLVWSRYFADALLRCPPTSRRGQSGRLALFNLGVLLVVVSVPLEGWPVTAVGALLLSGAVCWHVAVLVRQLRRALGNRFAPTVRFYVAAGLMLPLGAGIGVWLDHGGAAAHAQLRAAHVAVNVLGWLGLTVLGTLVTLWPTVLRTRIVPGAERLATRSLPVLVAGVLVTVTGAGTGIRAGVTLGLLLYLAGIAILAVPAVREARTKPPDWFPGWSIALGVGWLVGTLAYLAARAALASSWVELDEALSASTPLLAAGFVGQVLLGALSYLVPVVLGGGPRAVRAANRAMDAGGPLRLVVVNLGLLVCALPVPSAVRVIVSALVLAALTSFLPILVTAMRASRRARAEGNPPPRTERPAGQRSGLAVAGLALVLVGAASGAALDPAALAAPAASAADGVAPTGHTTRVEVVATGMRFTPATVSVPAGDALVITVRNRSQGDVHDLVLQTGAQTGRIAPGEAASVEVGVVGRDLDGWCSVLGHRQMGMVLRVEVEGVAPETQTETETEPAGSDPAHRSGHAMPAAPEASPPATYVPGRAPEPGFTASDARLPAVPPGRVHRIRLEVTETEQEVAPGVTQTVWSYGGSSPGPVLHGRVGDRFVVTLVNDGSIGHSIDFHAGALAPDRPMRTIEPGESLVYRFTATRAGIWMYHCSTMPMSAHIAAGLFGAVVIEPRDLPPVDRSYVLLQSEWYLGPQGGTPDLEALAAEEPDTVTFNGYADQYVHDPLPARVGERVRIWTLDAGPARPLSFHVVGGQFDRVWSEGAWRLGSASAPARRTGAQVLPLLPAQGGFVELTFPEPGHYPFVNHVMTDGERGARGVFDVRR